MLRYDKGYGVITNTLRWKDDAGDNLVKMFGPNLVEEYSDELAENPLKEFLLEHGGLETLLCEVINENEGLEPDTFRFADPCIYVSATIPLDAQCKEKMLTIQDIDRILKKYLSQLTEDKVKTTWLDVAL